MFSRPDTQNHERSQQRLQNENDYLTENDLPLISIGQRRKKTTTLW